MPAVTSASVMWSVGRERACISYVLLLVSVHSLPNAAPLPNPHVRHQCAWHQHQCRKKAALLPAVREEAQFSSGMQGGTLPLAKVSDPESGSQVRHYLLSLQITSLCLMYARLMSVCCMSLPEMLLLLSSQCMPI